VYVSRPSGVHRGSIVASQRPGMSGQKSSSRASVPFWLTTPMEYIDE
jgi:hypothetical protein